MERRKSLILFIVCLFMGFQLSAQGVDKRFSITFKNESLSSALKKIGKASGVRVEFAYEDVNPYKVTANLKEVTAQQAVRTVIDNKPLTYSVNGKFIVVSKVAKRITTPQKNTQRSSKKTSVIGQVLDSEGSPLVGATVRVKGTNSGSLTDTDGRFEIIMAGSETVLQFSYIGKRNVDLAVRAGSNIKVTLADLVNNLNECVVTGYQTISKERATGSFDIIKKSQLEKPSNTIAGRLIGAVAGIAASQDAYGNPTFQIRGQSTFTGNSSPLLVVDGFAVEGGYGSINPNDVESITVLKDAAAASIWGARSANGVIVVTTKSGKLNSGESKVSIDYSGYYKFMPKMDLDYAQSRIASKDVVDIEKEIFNKWGGSFFYLSDIPMLAGMATTSKVYEALNEQRQGYLSQSDVDALLAKYSSLDNASQIKKYLLQHAMTHQQNLSITINGNRSSSVFSLMYQNEHNHFKGNSDSKYMFNFRNKTNVFKWLDFTFNGMYQYENQNNSGIQSLSDIKLQPYEMLYDEQNQPIYYSYNAYLPFFDRYTTSGTGSSVFPYKNWGYNAAEEINARTLRTTTQNVRAQAGFTFKIINGLTFDTKIQYELAESNDHNYYKENSYTVRRTVNAASSWDIANNTVTQNLPSGGFLDQGRVKRDILTIRNQLNFNRTFLEKHAIALVAGLETIDNHHAVYNYPRTYGYDDDRLTVGRFPNGAGDGANLLTDFSGNSESFKYTNSFKDYTNRYFSAFGNLSYTYDDKYTISGSIRTDASNMISDDPSYRYSPFWSIGGSWQLGRENFMKDVKWIDMLNFRFTYGYNGNVDNSTTFKPLINLSSATDPYINDYTATIYSYGNPNLRWEKTSTWNLGADFNLFGGLLFGKFDVYRKYSKDLIASEDMSSINGTTTQRINNAEISNKGFEMELGTKVNIKDNITLTGSLSLSYNKNNVEKLYTSTFPGYYLTMLATKYDASYGWMQGANMNTLWCYEYAGLVNVGTETSPSMEPAIKYANGTTLPFMSVPLEDARSYIRNMGTKVAPWNAAVNLSLSFYDFDLGIIMTGKFGHKFMRESYNYVYNSSIKSAPNHGYYEVKNCDPNKMVPLPQHDDDMTYSTWNFFYPYMSYLATNAGLIRCQEISLSYNFPMSIIGKIGVKGIKAFAQVNNLFNIYFNKYGEDPEFQRGSIRLLPQYTFGLKFNF
jgi:TonB-linked SusC/RagA family outer membrane protein